MYQELFYGGFDSQGFPTSHSNAVATKGVVFEFPSSYTGDWTYSKPSLYCELRLTGINGAKSLAQRAEKMVVPLGPNTFYYEYAYSNDKSGKFFQYSTGLGSCDPAEGGGGTLSKTYNQSDNDVDARGQVVIPSFPSFELDHPYRVAIAVQGLKSATVKLVDQYGSLAHSVTSEDNRQQIANFLLPRGIWSVAVEAVGNSPTNCCNYEPITQYCVVVKGMDEGTGHVYCPSEAKSGELKARLPDYRWQ